MNIRKVVANDYRITEEMTRDAFWNKYILGCTEHFLLHNLRKCKEYVEELDLILEDNGEIISSIIYTKSYIEFDNEILEIVTFGPFCTKKEYQSKGYGEKLLRYSIDKVKKLGYKAIIIFGDPEYYKKYGFNSCYSYNISFENTYPKAMLVLELEEGFLLNKSGKYKYSDTFYIAEDEDLLEEYDKTFPYLEKFETQSQKNFIKLAGQFDHD